MKENVVVNFIEKSLLYKNRYYLNVHGSDYSLNGTPDIITSDKNGIFLGIEVKAPKEQPRVSQWRRAIEILNSNNNARIIIAYDDFDIDKVDNKELPIMKIDNIIGKTEYDLLNVKLSQTTEIKLK